MSANPAPSGSSVVLETAPLSFQWPAIDPFLFCVHHLDTYPAGNEAMGPTASLAGRKLGMDFELRDGWRMYHGTQVPGFPRHPHRGFETVTLARSGFIDHSDSLGATARFGHGDVQWMTAGNGIEHAEMFPLVNTDAGNTGELFQIWLNLPARNKRVSPHFTMLWASEVPRIVARDDAGREVALTLVSGAYGDASMPAPPPNSWASDPANGVAIWTMRFAPDATFTVPAAPGTNRVLYVFGGGGVQIGDREVPSPSVARVRSDAPTPIRCGSVGTEILMLQGKPIGEPVVQHGPFVMNAPNEIREAIADYQRGVFGRWPWSSDAPVHPRERGRFAVHADGRREEPS